MNFRNAQPTLLLLLVLSKASLTWTLSSNVETPQQKLGSNRAVTFPNSIAITTADVKTLIRQTGQVSPSKAAIGVPSCCNCQHGFPQVFSLDPLPATGRINSGLLKLTCPILVRAVDELEDEGLIHGFNKIVQEDPDLQSSILEAHNTHAIARKNGMREGEIESILETKLGQKGSSAFLQAGVAGSASGNVKDVKCLHAWLGDYLFRGPEKSPLGAMVASELYQKGFELKGTSNCHKFCDPSSDIAAEPPKPRNKQRLKTSKELARRKRNKS